MKPSTTSEQIAAALKQDELGLPLEEVLQQAGVSEQTFLAWKKKYSAIPAFPQDLKCLQQENFRLKQIVAELVLENAELKNNPNVKC